MVNQLSPELMALIGLGFVLILGVCQRKTIARLLSTRRDGRPQPLDPAVATDIASSPSKFPNWLHRSIAAASPGGTVSMTAVPPIEFDDSPKSPTGYLRLRGETETEGPPGTRGRGQIAILAVGTYGARQLPGILQQFERTGAADHVGTIYLLEFDDESRTMCMGMLPETFRDRVVQGETAHFPVGFSNASVERVYEHDELWRKDVEDRADQWLRRMQAATTPGLLLAVVSPGGMAGLGRPALDAFKQRYPHLPVYLITMLDNRQQVRNRFPTMRQLYLTPDLVRGAIVTDNRRDYKTSDDGIAYLFAGLIGATWVTDRPVTLWNSLGLIFSQDEPLRIGTLSTWIEPLPVATLQDASGELGRYIKTGLVEEKALRGIRAVVEDPSLQALAIDPVRDGSTLICLVTVPVDAGELQSVARMIEQRLKAWRERTGLELSIQFASAGAEVDPDINEAPLSVVLLQPLTGGAEVLDGLATQDSVVDPKFQQRTPYRLDSRATISTASTAQPITERQNGSTHPSEVPVS